MVKSIINLVGDIFRPAILKAVPNAIELGCDEPVISINGDPRFKHHYQCNSTMKIFQALAKEDAKNAPKEETPAEPAPAQKGKKGKKKKKAPRAAGGFANPRMLGMAIVDATEKGKLIEKLEVAGPGFINVFLSPEYLTEQLMSFITEGVTGATLEAPKKVAIDYSSPNIAKDMHVGHLRSTIIGDTLAKILEFAGHEVHRINHVGDWGTQFGMLILHLKETCPNVETETPDIVNLTQFYKDAKKRFDAEPDFKKQAQLEVVKLQSGDETNLRLWKALCKVSENMFREVYKQLQVDERLETVGESFYNPLIAPLLEELEARSIVEESEGAKVIKVDGMTVPLIVRKSDGGFGYDSTDLTAINYRLKEMGCDWLIYVVDSGQSLHFETVFKAAQKCGWYNPEETRVDHVGFGVVQGEDKKKFKTRSGDTVRLADLLLEAKDRARAELVEREESGRGHLGADEIDHAAEALGFGGVKYFDLRQHRLSDYVFNFDRMLSPDGDTAVYLQYVHARMSSIARKCDVDMETLIKEEHMNLAHPSEIALAAELCKFHETIEDACKDLTPHKICSFMFKVANTFNSFFRDCRVSGVEEQNSRLLICHATAVVLRQCMRLLGLTPLERI